MKKQLFLLAIFLLSALHFCFAQTTHFKKTFQGPGSDYAAYITPAINGGYFLYGNTTSSGFGLYDMYIIRIDGNGQILWWKNYGSHLNEGSDPNFSVWGVAGITLLQEEDGGLIASYAYKDTIPFPPVYNAIMKLDSNGNILSQHPFSIGDYSSPSQMIKSRFSNDYFLLIDIAESSDNLGIAKIDASGNITAIYNAPNTSWKHPSEFQQTADGGFIVTGTQEYNADYCWLKKLNSTGASEWEASADSGYISQSYARNVFETAGGNYLWLMTYSYGTIGQALIKLDHAGNKIWSKDIQPLNSDTVYFGQLYKIDEQTYALQGIKKVAGINQYRTLISIIDSSGNVISGKLFDFGNSAQLATLYFKNNTEIVLSGNYPGTTADILFGLTNINSSNECFESTYNLKSVNKPIAVYTNGFVNGTTVNFTPAPMDTLLVSNGWADSLICQIPLSIQNAEEDLIQLKIFPNPFYQSTKVKFKISKLSVTKVTVFDVIGREVSTLVNKQLEPGSYEVTFDGSNCTEGTYFCKLETDGFVEMKKMILIK